MSEKPDIQEIVAKYIFGPVPHHTALGLSLVSCVPGKAVIELPYDERFIGNPSTRVIHGGVITSLLDSVSGCAAFSALDPIRRVATLDLRIDYMRPAKPGEKITAIAECYRVTGQVAFVRAIAHDGDESHPVAASSGTFAIFETKGKNPMGAA